MIKAELTVEDLLEKDKEEFFQEVDGLEDVQLLQDALKTLFLKTKELEKKLEAAMSNTEFYQDLVKNKLNRLNEIKHGITELTERMLRPYLVSPELQIIKGVLETLSASGTCNSIIIEGEAGTGKTAWPYFEAGQDLIYKKDVILIHVRVKETMDAQSLLYTVDDVRRLNDAQATAQVPEIIRMEAIKWRDRIISGEVNPLDNDEYKVFFAKLQAISELSEQTKDLSYINYVDLGPLGEAIKQSGEGKIVWLLIDEIEKGREELMTGMLDEIEHLEFEIGETGTKIKGDKSKLRIVITTNTEDSDKIPASFRRRSLYHFMPYPTPEEMSEIVDLYFEDIDKQLLDYALNVFYEYHQHPDIEKKPSTPELLAWLQVLVKEYSGTLPKNIPHKEILLKFKEDHEIEIDLLNKKAKEEIYNSKAEMPLFVHRAAQGAQVYRLTDDINDYYYQEGMKEFYAALKNAGIMFNTPTYIEEYDDQGSDTPVYMVKDAFKFIGPGSEILSDNYFVIPDELIDIFKPVVRKKVLAEKKSVIFTSISAENSKFTKGTFDEDGLEKNGYQTKDGFVITEEDYVS